MIVAINNMMHYGQIKPKTDPEKLRKLLEYKEFLDWVEGIDTSADQSNCADDEYKLPQSVVDPISIEYLKVCAEIVSLFAFSSS